MSVKVKAGKRLNFYRNKVLGLKKEEFRNLQAGKEISIADELFKKYPNAFELVKEKVKDGN